ncbi:MAG: TolC family protein [Phycisphaerales bacterium]|nr:TolC family protein [Phycisphaerales bacterium]
MRLTAVSAEDSPDNQPLALARICTLCFACGLLVSAGLLAGCDQYWINSADTIANRVIRQRQLDALGATSDADIGKEDGQSRSGSDPYAFVPHPIDNRVPASFNRPAPLPEMNTGTNGYVDSNGVVVGMDDDEVVGTDGLRPFTLSEALAYAFHHAWDFQTQKEDLYLAALDLMTERQLWTPQLEGEIRARYTNYGQEQSFDQAMAAVSELSATQRLPYGGDVSARIVNVLMRDIGHHTTTGETGQMILEANIPLLKGAGRVAYESRYQTERNLIYAVRVFERNRRILTVDVAGDFFDLLAIKARIGSAQTALDDAIYDLNRTQALFDVGNVEQVEAQRSRVQVLDSRNNLITAEVQYRNALDRFKIRIGMPTESPIDAVDEDLDLFEPDVTEREAIATALKYRLDLINQFDFIDDAQRGVRIARNNFLPAFDFTGSVTMDTDPNRIQSYSYNTERTRWDAVFALELPIDRREERNDFRASLIELRRSERGYELARENVVLDVRSALRNVELARTSMEIQLQNIEVNKLRNEQARELFDRGKIRSNRDLVEAQNAVQSSTNQYANALADYRLAILALLRDCGTLRIDDDGYWVREVPTVN